MGNQFEDEEKESFRWLDKLWERREALGLGEVYWTRDFPELGKIRFFIQRIPDNGERRWRCDADEHDAQFATTAKGAFHEMLAHLSLELEGEINVLQRRKHYADVLLFEDERELVALEDGMAFIKDKQNTMDKEDNQK